MQQYKWRHNKNEKRGTRLGDGKFALGLTVGALLVLVTYVVMATWGSAGEFATLAQFVATILIGLSSAFLALRVLGEQKRTREAGTDPVLVAHFGMR